MSEPPSHMFPRPVPRADASLRCHDFRKEIIEARTEEKRAVALRRNVRGTLRRSVLRRAGYWLHQC